MGDTFLEYTAASPARFSLWQAVLADVAFAQDYGPAHGQPGYADHQRQASKAIEALKAHEAALVAHVDTADSRVAAQLEGLRRTFEEASIPASERQFGDVSLDLSFAVGYLEVLLLGLIGPEGQSPVPPYSARVPATSYLEAWLAAGAGTANLVPCPVSTQIVSWRTPRAFLRPAEMKDLPSPREVGVQECYQLVTAWNETSSTKRFVTMPDAADEAAWLDSRRHYDAALEELTRDLKLFAERGDVYLGWTASYDYD